MPAVTRLGDLCTGHGCYPPRPNITAASTVFVNGKNLPFSGLGDPSGLLDLIKQNA